MSVEPDIDADTPLWHESSQTSKMGNQAYIPADFEPSSLGIGSSANETNRASTPLVSGQMAAAPSSIANPSASIFSLSYYASFFDIDTSEVVSRCLLAVNPFNSTPFLADDNFGGQLEQSGTSSGVIAGGKQPDMYGPFWISTTVVFVLFFASTLVGLLFSSWEGVKYEYKFDLLTGAAGLMYSYTFIIPLILWLIVRYLDISPATTLPQLVCLYGYSNIIWIPVALLSVSPLFGIPTVSNIIRWVFITLGFLVSGAFLLKNLKNVLIPPESTHVVINRKPAYGILGLILAAHLGLTIAVKFLYFGGVKVNPDHA